MSNKFPGAKLPDPQENRGERERERGGERMGRGGIGPHHFSDQSYAPVVGQCFRKLLSLRKMKYYPSSHLYSSTISNRQAKRYVFLYL
jgi:hypothetical protein